METDEIRTILESRDFSRLIGLAEAINLEAKQESFDLTTAAGRYELAKDVSSLANAVGGYLLIGIATSREVERQIDTLDHLTLVPTAAFDAGRYRGVVAEYVYPQIDGLDVTWAQASNAENGIGIILVPEQPADRKPFLIAKMVEDGTHLRQIVAGYAERLAAGNEPLSPKRLQEALRKGFDGTSQRLTRIEERLGELVATRVSAVVPPPIGSDVAEGLESRVLAPAFDSALLDSRIASLLGSTEAPSYVIAAMVPPGNRVREFHSESPTAVRHLLRNAGELRHAGFDLGIDELAQPGPDGSLETVQGQRKRLRLFQDGTLIFCALADDSFLGWARSPEAFLAQPRLAPVPVVEVHASFVTVYSSLLASLQESPAEVMFKLVLRNFVLDNGQRLYLTEHVTGETWEWIDRRRYPVEAALPEATVTSGASDVRTDPLAVAYRLVEAFVALFDMPASMIPFVVETAGIRRIDVSAIGRR